MKKDKILVTGNTGFIGKHLVKKLTSLGQDVHGASLYGFGEKPVSDFDILTSWDYALDISDPKKCDQIIGRVDPDYVFHLAAQPLVETAFRSPADTFETNIRGAFNLLNSLHDYGTVKGIVWVSTDKVYGPYKRAVKETDELLGFSHPYDVSKLCGDLLAQMYASCYGLPIVIVRSGNIYGPGDDNSDRLIPGTILSTLDGDPVSVRSDGRFVRDYIYVDDIVNGYLYALSALMLKKLKSGEAVNFGSEKPYSVMEVIDTIIEQMGRIDLVPKIENTQKHEIPYQHLDWSKAKSLGWTPKVSLEEGLKRTISWYKENAR